MNTRWPGQEIVYLPPKPDAYDGEVMAYYWPPRNGESLVLFVDGAAQVERVDENGRLMNTRLGKIVRETSQTKAPP